MTRHLCHEDYTVGWVCALPVELAAAQEMLDEEHPDLDLANNDDNLYALGSISGHNVVIVCLPAGRIGNNPAASVATQMRATFKKIQFGLMVGIGGGVPSPEADVRLGDVVVSQPSGQSAGVVQYDMGKTTPSGFERTGSLNSPPQILLAAVARLKANQLRGRSKLIEHISKLEGITQFQRSRAGPDVLFEPTYDHVGGQTCDECSPDRQQVRPVRDIGEEVAVHYGTIASGNQVLRSATERDKVSTEFGKVLCFEMEAAGLMNTFPCLVVRGICDYADSHKNKRWQPYAAGTAAAYAKEVLSMIPPADLTKWRAAEAGPKKVNGNLAQTTYHIPFPMNRRFVGRKTELQTLQQRLMVNQDCQELSIVGLGGTGKTQVALQFAYSVKEERPEYSIFWVPALSMESFEQACVSIARALGLPQMGDNEDIRELVKQYLSSSQAGKWLMVVDNADDPSILYETAESPGIVDYLPKSDTSITLYTTRTMDVAVSLTQPDVLELEAMNPQDAIEFFSKSLIKKEILRNRHMTNKLLDELTCLPLAIAQAAAYLNMNRTTIEKYLQLLHNTKQDLIGLLSREFRDNTRYKGSANAVATTWVVSFSQLRESNPMATGLLKFISCIEWKAIPRSLLPKLGSEEQIETAIGTLCGYSFLVRRGSGNLGREVGVGAEGEEEKEQEEEGAEAGEVEWYDMHRLVHLATQIWLKNHNSIENVVEATTEHITHIFPNAHYKNRATWRAYLPHALRLLDTAQGINSKWQLVLCQQVGSCLMEDGRYREAIVRLERSIRLNRHVAKDDPDIKTTQSSLASAYVRVGQIQKAIALLEHLAELERSLSPDDPLRLVLQHRLAQVYQRDGQIQKAIALLEHVVKVEEALAPDDPLRLMSQEALAGAYTQDGQQEKAVALLEYVVATQVTLAPEDPSLLGLQYELAIAYQENKQVEEAIPILEHVVRLQDQSLGPEHPHQMAAKRGLAAVYTKNEQLQKAIALLEEVLNILETTLGPEHPDFITSQHMLALAYTMDGQSKKATPMLENVVAFQARFFPEDHPLRLRAEENLADLRASLTTSFDFSSSEETASESDAGGESVYFGADDA